MVGLSKMLIFHSYEAMLNNQRVIHPIPPDIFNTPPFNEAIVFFLGWEISHIPLEPSNGGV